MYSVYAVVEREGEKDRRFVGATVDEFEATHIANMAICAWADYAYVKTIGEGAVFFIKKPD